MEVIFVDNRCKYTIQLPAELTDVKRVDSINILGVTVTNTLSISQHVDRVGLLSNCAQSVFALKTLRAHGLNRECLHNVFNAVILAKLTYGASAWIGFTRASERDRIKAFIRRCIRFELCSDNTKTFAEMYDTYDNHLFNNITHNPHHISSTSYFRQSPQLQKTIILEHANTIGCSRNVQRISVTLILFIELFILTFINFLLQNYVLILLCCGLSTC